MALCLHPDVVEKAHREIDSVVGNERLPTFEDRPHLPYINALVMEVFRWHAVVPTGLCWNRLRGLLLILALAVPHRAIQDDTHEGYFIPKGALVIPNIWYGIIYLCFRRCNL